MTNTVTELRISKDNKTVSMTIETPVITTNNLCMLIDTFKTLTNNKDFTCIYYNMTTSSVISTYTRVKGSTDIIISDNTVPSEPLSLAEFRRTFIQAFYDTEYTHALIHSFNNDNEFIILSIDN